MSERRYSTFAAGSEITVVRLVFSPKTQTTDATSEEPTTIHIPGPITHHQPQEIQFSLRHLQADHSTHQKIAFVMMRFNDAKAHNEILTTIRKTVQPYGIVALRADDKWYHEDLYYNILTYCHACTFGIAVFDRIEDNHHNPNVALEVGYLMALGKHVCILKDKTIEAMQTDLIGKLYKKFDTQDAKKTIPSVLTKWLVDRSFTEPA